MYHNVSVVPHINSEYVIGLLQKTRKAQLCDTCIIPGAYQHIQGSTQQEERVKCLKLLYYSVVMCSLLEVNTLYENYASFTHLLSGFGKKYVIGGLRQIYFFFVLVYDSEL